MPEPRERIVEAIVASPHGRRLEFVVEDVREDRVRIRMPFAPDRTTVGDTVHGGAIAALLDTAGTAAAWSGVARPERHRGTTVGFSINFLDAAQGIDLVAEGRVIRRGSSVVVCGVTVGADDGRRIAEGLVTYKLSRAPAAAGPLETLAEMFASRPPDERKGLLAELERGGAALYRQLADAETDAKTREALLEAAAREEENAALLERLARG